MTYDIAVILLAAGLITMPVMVADMAAARGVDVDRALACVEAESNWDPGAIGDDGNAVGLWQFHGSESVNTWPWACRLTGHPEWADDVMRLDPVASTIVALDMIERDYGGLWSGWGEE